jgi:penicillin-binding protein 1A
MLQYKTPKLPEFGATLALPIWIDSMHQTLSGQAEVTRSAPENVTNVDGKWRYSEYENGVGVPTLGMDEPPAN